MVRKIQGHRGLSPYQVRQIAGRDRTLEDAAVAFVQELEDVRLTNADICQRH